MTKFCTFPSNLSEKPLNGVNMVRMCVSVCLFMIMKQEFAIAMIFYYRLWGHMNKKKYVHR